MRIAFIADIHANLEALQACLASAAREHVDRIVFLGDIVGYGADPGPCVDIVTEHCAKGALAVRGNHDEAVVNSQFRMSEAASAAMRWTRGALSTEQTRFLTALPLQVTDGDSLYVHASAKSSATYPYVHGLAEALESLTATTAVATFVGHVHKPALYNITSAAKVIGFIPISDAPIPLSRQRRWLAVMGAAGQPRDGNPAAAYGIFDTDTNALRFLRVPYDHESAAAKIRALGLPDILWKRLAEGR